VRTAPLVVLLMVLGVCACDRTSSSDGKKGNLAGAETNPANSAVQNRPAAVQGQPIRGLTSSNRSRGDLSDAGTGQGMPGTAGLPVEERVVNGRLQLDFGRLSGFPYRVYEYHAEGISGRPLLRSDDKIPEAVQALNGRAVSVKGFVLPLRTRKGQVTEFLLLRDQGTCCFGPQAQINHFVRTHFPAGREFEAGRVYRVSGTLRVGETYVQGYLTGIYQLEAETVEGE
jgi:hypothetical protein